MGYVAHRSARSGHAGYHRLELPPAQEQAIGVARQGAEVPAPIEGLRLLVDAVEDDGDHRERAPGVVAVPQRLGEQAAAEPFPLQIFGDTEPGQYGDRQIAPGKLSRQVGWQVTEICLGGGERGEAGDGTLWADERPGCRQAECPLRIGQSWRRERCIPCSRRRPES